jgi:hypothetical protein
MAPIMSVWLSKIYENYTQASGYVVTYTALHTSERLTKTCSWNQLSDNVRTVTISELG